MGKPSTPAAPDYTKAAEATAGGNLDMAKYTTQANRVNQNTPYGNITYKKTAVVDQAAYDKALADYNAKKARGEGDVSGLPGQLQSGSLAAPDIANFTTDQWQMDTTLSPEQQALFDQNQQTNKTLGDVAQQGVGYVQNAMNSPLQQRIGVTGSIYNNAGQIQTDAGNPELLQQQVSDALYGQQTQYLDPQFQQSQQALDSQLANQGITRGSEAYNTAMNNASLQKQRAYGDARQTAIGQGVSAAQGMYGQQLAGMQAGNQALGQQFGQGLQAAQFGNQASAQQLAQDQTIRNDPVNMLNAVRTGQQMQVAQMPQQQNVAQMGQVAGADYMGAALGQGQYNQGMYNANSAQQSGLWGGIGGLAGGAAGMYFGGPQGAMYGASAGSGIGRSFSDRRLKKNIIKIGQSAKGYGLYVWEYLWGEVSCGVMADEIEKIMPEAVSLHPSGFKMVNYSMLGA